MGELGHRGVMFPVEYRWSAYGQVLGTLCLETITIPIAADRIRVITVKSSGDSQGFPKCRALCGRSTSNGYHPWDTGHAPGGEPRGSEGLPKFLDKS